MNILIVGLGLMGASYASGLRKKGHTVYGVDINKDSIEYAKEYHIIDDGSLNPSDFINKVDLLILGLYPFDILDFIKKYHSSFNENLIVTDLCGVKRHFIDEAISLTRPATYISHHPMAGREKVGARFNDPNIFKGANFLIIDKNNKEREINVLKELAAALEFGKISIITPEKHDKMIGFTSQLAHAIAVSLVNSDTEEDTNAFIGDSYRDLTRIAKINRDLWSELFFSNKDYLISEINNFEQELEKLKNSLINDDSKALKDIFVKAKEKREKMEK